MRKGIDAVTQGIRLTNKVDYSAYKPGTCFTPDKIKFHSEDEVSREAARLGKKREIELFYYQCGRHWHLTSKRHSK